MQTGAGRESSTPTGWRGGGHQRMERTILKCRRSWRRGQTGGARLERPSPPRARASFSPQTGSARRRFTHGPSGRPAALTLPCSPLLLTSSVGGLLSLLSAWHEGYVSLYFSCISHLSRQAARAFLIRCIAVSIRSVAAVSHKAKRTSAHRARLKVG